MLGSNTERLLVTVPPQSRNLYASYDNSKVLVLRARVLPVTRHPIGSEQGTKLGALGLRVPAPGLIETVLSRRLLGVFLI